MMPNTPQKKRGFASLLITVMLLAVAGVLMLSSSKLVIDTQKNNQKNLAQQQAFNAAQAGLNYASVLAINQYTTLNFINHALTLSDTNLDNLNQSLTEGSVTKIVLNNAPTGYDSEKRYVLIQSTGLSNDGSTQKTVQHIVKARTSGSGLNYAALDNTSRQGITIVNFEGGETVATALTVEGQANSLIANGPSSTGIITDASLYQSSPNSTTFFEKYFKKSIEEIRAQAQQAPNYYDIKTRGYSANVLKDKKNQLIWIDQNAGQFAMTGSERIQIGTPEEPVILVIHKPNNSIAINFSGSDITLYGILYVRGVFAGQLNGLNVIGGFLHDQVNAINTVLNGHGTFAYSAAIVNTVNQRFGTDFPARAITLGHRSRYLIIRPDSPVEGDYLTLANAVLGSGATGSSSTGSSTTGSSSSGSTAQGISTQGIVPGTWKDFGLVPANS